MNLPNDNALIDYVAVADHYGSAWIDRLRPACAAMKEI